MKNITNEEFENLVERFAEENWDNIDRYIEAGQMISHDYIDEGGRDVIYRRVALKCVEWLVENTDDPSNFDLISPTFIIEHSYDVDYVRFKMFVGEEKLVDRILY